MISIGVLASGNGSNLQAIIDACRDGTLSASVDVVISNNSRSGALDRARKEGIEACHLSTATHPNPEALDLAMVDTFRRCKIDLIVTAGYLKKLGPLLLASWKSRIVNIHPSLLPRHGGLGMYGINVHRAVIDSGDQVTGITIHRVSGDYDTGDVLAQKTIPVDPDDTAESLSARVLKEEHGFLIATLRDLIERISPAET